MFGLCLLAEHKSASWLACEKPESQCVRGNFDYSINQDATLPNALPYQLAAP
jgi:hypothetical protein